MPELLIRTHTDVLRAKYAPLMNDYIPILIEAEQTSKPTPVLVPHIQEFGLGVEGKGLVKFHERANDLRSAALAQCKTYRISDAKCPARRSIQ